MKRILALSACLLSFSLPASAEWSSTFTLASDYLFNGVSQTDESPALQASIDWEGKSGWYAGAWASNVDFGDDTNLEVDLYLGLWQELNDNQYLDFGFAQYTYHGGDFSDEGNYAEVYGAYGFGNTEIRAWYAWDYFGTNAGHYIIMATHTIPYTDQLSFELGIDRSASLDDNNFEWEAGNAAYVHYHATAHYSLQHFDISLGIHSTDLDTYGDTRLLLMVNKTIGW
ncbi:MULTISPECIES: TorF family putative porin [Gammaproteobacteria]|uniref:TorF family putative porin n=1 Tax=Gammaproteobacteria TaxID=1236 RepID=UPI000DD07843|nr:MULTISPECIES: TorF family putative porin [Gammaproteobacteria]RTE86014.1 hypothetical protein DQX04_05425 [Aliidiomarina sp. B3213]TCZ91368.1 hypothetical protein EYQ95_05435 [Lysobacter sp. N42]